MGCGSSAAPDNAMLRLLLAEIDPEFDPVPEELIRVSEGLFICRTIDADLAALD